MNKLPNSKDIVSFLNTVKPDSKCPFCGHSELISEYVDERTLMPLIHDSVKVQFENENSKMKISKEQMASPYVQFICANCGFIFNFHYEFLMRKIKVKDNANK